MRYIVITHVTDAAYQDAFVFQPKKRAGDWYYDDLPTSLTEQDYRARRVRSLVVHPGELLICNDDGREIAYPQRRPGKWVCYFEVYKHVAQALAKAQAITEEWGAIPRQVPAPQSKEDWDRLLYRGEEERWIPRSRCPICRQGCDCRCCRRRCRDCHGHLLPVLPWSWE